VSRARFQQFDALETAALPIDLEEEVPTHQELHHTGAKCKVSSVKHNYPNFTLTYPKKVQDFKNSMGMY